jgi:hypothetical protein
MMRKIAGDSIAYEMARLLKVAQEAKEPKKSDSVDDEVEDKAEDSAEVCADDKESDSADDWSAEDFIMDDKAPDHAEDNLSHSMEAMADFADDEDEDNADDEGCADDEEDMALDAVASRKNLNLMKGLGKIEASLRRKGENFAADLVNVTASEVKEDIIKEAKTKELVKNELLKMAVRLSRNGEKKALSMIRDTLLKFNK